MTTFLFWNTNKKPVKEAIAALVETHMVDVLVLAEFSAGPVELLQQLNQPGRPVFHQPYFGSSKNMFFFTRFSSHSLRLVDETDRVSICRLTLPERLEILLAAVHFPSKLYWKEESQAIECTELARAIRLQEEKAGHNRTALVGDLNMNPFETGLVSAAGLNAVMTRDLAERRSRTVQSRAYPFFYNPMWSYFGDRHDGPPGTYYYERSEHVCYFWNVFDQVLLRPDLMNRCALDGVRILTRAGRLSLLSNDGKPNAEQASDHLPLLFELDL
jgi:endonuclease/exonuclease/phosphatase family metal-dependent hydrolase